MPRPKWTTSDQESWLLLRLSDFNEARAKGKKGTTDWFLRIYEDWFTEFPPPPPTPADIAQAGGDNDKAIAAVNSRKKKQVYWWYYNHKGIASSAEPSGGTGQRRILALGKQKRKLQRYHAYLRLHGEKIMPEVESRWRAQGNCDAKAKIAFIANMAKELLDQETDEVKAAVEAYRETRAGSDGDDIESQGIKRKQNAIDSIPATLEACLNDLQKLTCWVGSVIVGGPDPRTGNYQSFVYHVGTTANANARFDQVSDSWADVEADFGNFLPKCFGPSTASDLHVTYTRAVTPLHSRQTTPESVVNEENIDSPGKPDDNGEAGPSGGQGEAAANTAGNTQLSSPVEPTRQGDNTFDDERERQIQRNKELLHSLGLDTPWTTSGKQSKPPSKASGPSSRPKPKPVSARQLRSKATIDAPENPALLQQGNESAMPSVVELDVPPTNPAIPVDNSTSSSVFAIQPVTPQDPSDIPSSVEPVTPLASRSAPAGNGSLPVVQLATIQQPLPPSDEPPLISPPTTPMEITFEEPLLAAESEQEAATVSRVSPSPQLPAASPSTEILHDNDTVLTGVPEWFQKVYLDLISTTDDPAWRSLCVAWIEHERRLGFNENVSRLCNRLPVEQRPREVAYWLARGVKR
ncbi:hypothetical protein BDY19DRAFT_998589 [Irpex rosettiformis]|uniref:Uncharacterized protein n=1 Tax=Irpex rosettiformis TaxID=378272 RepID=A0ACB8TN47_9APHY|nr:hypothetical protein BDY19DRAFT_998589 [Irpex rosettiformis]